MALILLKYFSELNFAQFEIVSMFNKATLSSRLRFIASASLLVLAMLAGNAYAGVLYNGAMFSLNLDHQSGNTYTFTYTADFTGWNAAGQPNQDFIAAVNFKPNTGMTPTVDSFSTTAPGIWSTPTLANANNSGCAGGASSFVCTSDLLSPFAAPTTTGAIYKWTFKLTYGSALPLSAFSDAPFRAWFLDSSYYTSGKGTGLLSTSTDISVPAPGAVGLLGLGLLALGVFANTRRRLVA